MLEKEEILKFNCYKLFKLDLAMEDYEDDNKIELSLLNEVTNELNVFRREKDKYNLDSKIELSNNLLKKYDDVLSIIGREHFVFYENGDINYIWKEKNNG